MSKNKSEEIPSTISIVFGLIIGIVGAVAIFIGIAVGLLWFFDNENINRELQRYVLIGIMLFVIVGGGFFRAISK